MHERARGYFAEFPMCTPSKSLRTGRSRIGIFLHTYILYGWALAENFLPKQGRDKGLYFFISCMKMRGVGWQNIAKGVHIYTPTYPINATPVLLNFLEIILPRATPSPGYWLGQGPSIQYVCKKRLILQGAYAFDLTPLPLPAYYMDGPLRSAPDISDHGFRPIPTFSDMSGLVGKRRVHLWGGVWK